MGEGAGLMLRRLLVAAFFLGPPAAHAQSLALTFDDGLDPATEPHAGEWNAQILEGLKSASLSAMMFPALSKAGGKGGLELVREWSAAGHLVGNHTATHRSLASGGMSLASFIADVEQADRVLRQLPAFRRMLRFPMLKEGNTLEKRDGIRTWMRGAGYRAAPVSIDASDWYFNALWIQLTSSGQLDKRARLQRAYVAHLLDRAAYYDALAREVLGRSPRHVMLLHVNAINAASLADIVEAFRAKGWTFVPAADAFTDPLYAMQPDILPAGESIVWALAKQAGHAGLRYPGEDSVYEEPRLRELGLLP